MRTKTWKPGTDKDLDNLFEALRVCQYKDTDHRLNANYGSDFLKYCVALTICFDDNDVPEMCASISNRDCWPSGAYRILNRLWKANNKIAFPRQMSPSFGLTTLSQISWLEKNTDCDLYFISRQTPSWKKFVIDEFKRQYDIEWQSDHYKYLTCPNPQDNSCWQTILYRGDTQVLTSWTRRPLQD